MWTSLSDQAAITHMEVVTIMAPRRARAGAELTILTPG